MAFLNIQNLFAPFTNKVHMIAVFMVALLFVVFRLHGGSFSLEDPRATNTYKKRTKTQRVIRRTPPTQTRTTAKPVAARGDEKPKPAEPRNARTPVKPRQPANAGLDDIERSLGLR